MKKEINRRKKKRKRKSYLEREKKSIGERVGKKRLIQAKDEKKERKKERKKELETTRKEYTRGRDRYITKQIETKFLGTTDSFPPKNKR